MLDSRIARSACRAGGLAASLLVTCATLTRGDLPPGQPFAVPKDRAEWEARRPSVVAALAPPAEAVPGQSGTLTFAAAEERDGLIIERVTRPGSAAGAAPRGVFVRPGRVATERRIPLIVLVPEPDQTGADALAAGWDGRPPALVLARFDFATLALDPVAPRPLHVRSLRAALDDLLLRPEVDPDRIAVVGLGRNGLTALGWMAADPRVRCGVAAIESQVVAAGASESTPCEQLAALCAPRPLCLMVGEPLPLPPAARSVAKTLERVAKGTYKVYGNEGTGLTFSQFGEFAGHDSVNTRLQWMAALEHLDKRFRPQGPTPLGHAPQPEPTFEPGDPDVANLTAAGIAGWAPEMSGRDSTWTWRDGVVTCQPKAHEYGWLRCPVEVSDFLLQVEWQVPAHGNAGIFLRAQPVAWFLPPTEENRLRVMTLGLTWPSRTGLELQTQDDPGQANRYSTGSLYRHAAPSANPTHSPNQWNRSTVRARGTRIEVWNNGVQVLDADLNQSDATLPNPPLRGYFGLQNHGAPAEYRAIRLKRLSPSPPGPTGH